MTRPWLWLMAILTCLTMTTDLTAVSLAQAQKPNPLTLGSMPKCGPFDAAFEKLFKDLNLRRSWRGTHENQAGELELAVGPGGAWFLLYHARDGQDRPRVCLIARGNKSTALFGNPV